MELPTDAMKGLCPKCMGQIVFGLVAEGPTVASVSEKPGDRIGRYHLLQQIGEGGCGVVYMAEQEEPVKRRVALKIIKLGMDTKQVVARFEAERQALAMMDHPNIAKVLDAGATETGRPYFVMELVRGIKITEFCDENRLPTEERLNLFVQVCHAIQHAHQKGVIHRDIKPSNILVTLHDGKSVPKVIDFGIAKATQQRLTDKTLFTAFEQFIGTPAYMSPEQAEMSGLDIDTRSDIYSLGVLLYELLTGTTPFDPQTLVAAGLNEMRRIIRELEPVRPSTRISTMVDAERTVVGKHRQADAPKLIHFLRGDLDWIVMKCLEKDRSRRYEAANGLATDIQRHLANEPVAARPASAAYRVQKFVGRNKLLVSAAAVVAAVLVLGILVSTWLAIRANRLRAQAEVNERKALEAQASEAKQRDQAQTQELAARRSAYAADVNLAQQALAVNNLGRAEELLNRHRPQLGERDLRGWEWRYLWQHCRSEALYTLCRQSNSIVSLSVSADGKWLAIGEQEGGGLSVWDLRTRQEVTRLSVGDFWIKALFSPRDSLLAFSLVSTNRVYLWNPITQQTVNDLPLDGVCVGLGFSDDGRRLVTRTPGSIELWQIPEGKKLARHSTTNHTPSIRPSVVVTRDLAVGALITRRNNKSHILVFDLTSGAERWAAKTDEMAFQALAFSPDGRILATSSGHVESAIRLWDVATGRELRRLEGHHSYVHDLLFWPDGKTLASASADQTIGLWDLTDLSDVPPPRFLHGHRLEVWRLALLPDRTTLVSGCKDGSVCLWDTAVAGRKDTRLILPGVSWGFSFASDSRSLISWEPPCRVVRWRGANFQEREPLLEFLTDPLEVSGSDDGGWVAEGSTNGILKVWDLSQPGTPRQFTVSSGAVTPRLLLRQGKTAVLEGSDDRCHEWDLTSLRETRSWSSPKISDAFDVVSTDEQWWLSLTKDGAGFLRDFATGHETPLNLDIKQVAHVTFAPDGKNFAAASELGYVKVWQTATRQRVGEFRGFLLSANSVAFSPDGQRLAIGSAGKEAIKLWDVPSQQQLLTLEGEGSLFWISAFSPDGSLLGACNRAYQLHLWRAPSWAEIDAIEKGETARTREQ
jgi:eukaryotic-like serine/threonine-protein kinase